MNDIRHAIARDIIKKASYDSDSLSYAIENAKTPEAMNAAMQNAIQKYRDSGDLVDESFLGKYLIGGPHTRTTGSNILAGIAKAVNTIRPDTIDYNIKPLVDMAGVSGETMIEDYTNNSHKYMDSVSPGIAQKVYDAVAAHEILESEAMNKNLDGIVNTGLGSSVGGLAGLLGAAALAYAVKKGKKKLDADLVRTGISMPLLGMGIGAGAGALYNKARGIPGMEDGWSSHMSADIPRLESKMLHTIGDPALTEIFKAMRTQTGERRAIQEATMQDYGEALPIEKLKAMQEIDPMQFFS